jgi:hypothetical protein
MADGVTVDNGAGTDYTVNTDEVTIGGLLGHAQRVKLVDGADGGTALIGGDATNGLDVDVTRVTGTVTVDSELPAAAALADTTATPTAPAVGAHGMLWDNVASAWQRLRAARGETGGSSGFAIPMSAPYHYDGSLFQPPRGDTTGADHHLVPKTSGGLVIGPASNAKLISAASTNATSVKGSAGQVFGWFIFNANASTRYVKLYNKATAPTVGTDTPTIVLPIPGGSAANVEFTNGIAFGTGIALALTTGMADSDTGAVAASDLVVNLFYK